MNRSGCALLLVGVVTVLHARAEEPAAVDAHRAPPRVLVAQTGHAISVESVAFSRDGELILTGAADGTVILWEARSGRQIRTFAGRGSEVHSVAFAADGSLVLAVHGGLDDAGYFGTAMTWDAKTGERKELFPAVEGESRCAALSPDGRWLVTGGSSYEDRDPNEGPAGQVVLWDTQTGEPVAASSDLENGVHSIAYCADGKRVLSGGENGEVLLWNLDTGEKQLGFKGHDSHVSAVAFTADCRFAVTASWDGSAILWDVETGQQVRKYAGHEGDVKQIAFSPDGKWVATAETVLIDSGDKELIEGLEVREFRSEGKLIVWDRETGLLQHTLTGHRDEITCVAFSPDARQLLSCSQDKTAILWDLETGDRPNVLRHKSSVDSGTFSPDGLSLATVAGDECVIWSVATGEKLRFFYGDRSFGCEGIGFSSNGKHLLAGDLLFDVTTGERLQKFEGESYARAAALSPDGRLVATAGEEIVLWDTKTGEKLRTISVSERIRFHHLEFDDEGKRLLCHFGYRDEAVLLDVATGKSLATFRGKGFSDTVHSAALSPDGRYVVTGTKKKAILWDTQTGQQVQAYEGHTQSIRCVAVSPTGEQLLTAGGGSDYDPELVTRQIVSEMVLWDLNTGTQLFNFTNAPAAEVKSVAFSPDGQRILAGHSDGTAVIYDAATGERSQIMMPLVTPQAAVAFASDGDQVRLLGDSVEVSWNLHGGLPEQRRYPSDRLLALSPDGRFGLLSDREGAAVLHRFEDAQNSTTKVSRFETPWPDCGAVAPAGRYVFTSFGAFPLEWGTYLWDGQTGERLHKLEGTRSSFSRATFSQEGTKLLTGDVGHRAILWDVASGEALHTLQGHRMWVTAVAISPDGAQLATGAGDLRVIVWNAAIGEKVHTLEGHAGWIYSVCFTPDGRQLVSGDGEGTCNVWDLETGQRLRSFNRHQARVGYLAISPDGKRVLSSSGDIARLWTLATGEEICSFVKLQDEGWALITPDGRFDIHDLRQVRGLQWVAADQPLEPLPIEIFMRDYYEPRLLAKVIAGEKLPPLPDLTALNRVQPLVEISDIQPHADRSDEVAITVELVDQSRDFERGGRKETVRSGVYDVRLFRDGQLVAYHPQPDGAVELDEHGRARVRFEHIKLPRRPGTNEIEFSAYAFNADRVKSETHRVQYTLPELTPRQGVAYVICIGVNAFESPEWDLRFAVPDAEAMAAEVSARMAGNPTFSRVVTVRLQSTASNAERDRRFAKKTATKENIRRVLAALAGEPVDQQLIGALPRAAEIERARPEDFVLISFSTHGYYGDDGQFYLFPADIGTGHGRRVGQELLRRAISTAELSNWLRDVDAGEMVMIVDACQSAATVEQEGFKPGPMGSRGFGQLAYNKRMRILAASQASDLAFEDPRIRHGLLTYALCRDGLAAGAADFQPADGRISLGEWLRYAVQRVPALAEDIALGKLSVTSAAGRNLRQPADAVKGQTSLFEPAAWGVAQQPALFDFTATDELILARTATEDSPQ